MQAWNGTSDLAIRTSEDWDAFAASVRNGNSYQDKTVTLGANITITTVAGTYTDKTQFMGTFDGNGKTLTLNLICGSNSAADGYAPF